MKVLNLGVLFGLEGKIFPKKLPLNQAGITLCAIWVLRISESSKLLLKACGLDRIQILRPMAYMLFFSILASLLFVLRSEDALSKRMLLGKISVKKNSLIHGGGWFTHCVDEKKQSVETKSVAADRLERSSFSILANSGIRKNFVVVLGLRRWWRWWWGCIMKPTMRKSTRVEDRRDILTLLFFPLALLV